MSSGVVTTRPGQIDYLDGQARPLSLDRAGRVRVAVEQADGSSSAVANSAVDRSGGIAAGGESQVLAPANASRRGLWIQNNSPADLYVNELSTANADGAGVRIGPGDTFMWGATFGYVPKGAVSIFGVQTGLAFAAREW